MTRVAGFGEPLLRLKAPGAGRILQNPGFEATFGGAELNVLASLSRLGHEATYITALPGNPLGDAALAEIRRHGISDRHIVRKEGRMGLYFMEQGAGVRPSQITYDRENSAFSQIKDSDYDWKAILGGVDWLHLTGITPALGAGPAAVALAAARAAQNAKIPVSLDLNYRPQLWASANRSPGEAMTPFLDHISILFAGPSDSATCFDMPPESYPNDRHGFKAMAQQMMARHSNLSAVVSTFRQAPTADLHTISAIAADHDGLIETRPRTLDNIVDRIGAGDAFAAGFIHGMLSGWMLQKSADFGLAAEALKHYIPGDINLGSLSDIEAIMKDGNGGRVHR